MTSREALIVDVVRTPRAIGKPGKGAYSSIHPQRLLAAALNAIQTRNGLDTRLVDEVVAGCNNQIGKQASCIARMSLLDAGWDPVTPGVTVQRFCGSGLTAVSMAVMGMLSGMQKCVVAGGVESMSHVSTLPLYPLMDAGNSHLRKLHPQPHQGICADVIATIEGFRRADLDSLALESQRRADHAIRSGYFAKSLVPVHNENGSTALDRDEYPRPNTTLEGLASLKPAFAGRYDDSLNEEATTYRKLVEQSFPGLQVDHVHHAGNSSGVVDGAAVALIVTPEFARAHGIKPRAKIIATVAVGDSPELMLNAPVPAARRALSMAGMSLSDIDLFEVNEAFAVVPLKFMRDLGIDSAKVNVNGGAIALGHPIGATGTMILGTLLDELERRNLATGLVTMCTGGGMAPAMIVERL